MDGGGGWREYRAGLEGQQDGQGREDHAGENYYRLRERRQVPAKGGKNENKRNWSTVAANRGYDGGRGVYVVACCLFNESTKAGLSDGYSR